MSGSAADAALTRWDDRPVTELARAWQVPRVEAYAVLASTNDRARALALAGAPSWTTVVADEQSRGRGRHGSTWISRRGAGLWMSTILRLEGEPGALPLVVGLACAEAVEEQAPDVEVGLKWPNDVMVGDAKVGGILCERTGDAVVVGVGLNLSDAPTPDLLDVASVPAAALEAEASKPLSRSMLAGAILQGLRDGVASRLSRAGGLTEAAREALARRDVLGGRRVETEQAGAGRAVGIDGAGALRLEVEGGGEVRIVSGSVRLSPTGSDGAPVPERA